MLMSQNRMLPPRYISEGEKFRTYCAVLKSRGYYFVKEVFEWQKKLRRSVMSN